MPTTWPARLRSGPPELPGLTAASNWMRPLRVGPSPTGMVRSSPEMTPALSEPTSPSGCPTANASSPTWRPPAAEHRGHDHLRRPVGRQHGDVVLGVLARRPRPGFGAVGEGHLDRAGAGDDVAGGEDRAVVVHDHARAQPLERAAVPTGRCPRDARPGSRRATGRSSRTPGLNGRARLPPPPAPRRRRPRRSPPPPTWRAATPSSPAADQQPRPERDSEQTDAHPQPEASRPRLTRHAWTVSPWRRGAPSGASTRTA